MGFATCGRFRTSDFAWVIFSAIVVLGGLSRCVVADEEAAFKERPFLPVTGETWRAYGISYGPFRTGQEPGGEAPTIAQIREDLHLIAPHWQMLRTYGSDQFSRDVCQVILDDKLPLKVMVGAWVETEATPEDRQANQAQVSGAISIANDFPSVVAAVCIGNESQVFWSFHKVDTDVLLGYIREARKSTKAPITVADDFLFWIDESSQRVAAELDFIVTHVYAMWHAQQLDAAMPFTKEKFSAVRKAHPDKIVVLGETGWCTEKLASGDQAERLQGVAGEAEQAEFFKDVSVWSKEEQVPLFYFEAFDEDWKGSDDPSEAEKHWGLFHVDRTPKTAMKPLLDAADDDTLIHTTEGQ